MSRNRPLKRDRILELYNSARHVRDTNEVGEDTDPEQFDLVLRDECDDSGYSENGYQIYQIVRAAGDHGGRGSGSRHADYLAHALPAVYQSFNVLVEGYLNPEAYRQTDDEIPIGRELFDCEVPSGNQRQY